MLAKYRIAWRSLRRRPAYLTATVLILALGSAATTTVFSIVDATLLKPLPYPDSQRLVTVYEASPKTGKEGLIAPARLEDWNRLNHTFEAISGNYTENVTDTSGAEPERLAGRRTAPRFFQVYRSEPAAGRFFSADEEEANGPPVAVISHALWMRRYRGAQTAIGGKLRITNKSFTIVGVAPASFASAVDVWIPAQTPAQLLAIREARFFSGIGRLRAGVTMAQAQSDLARIQMRLGEQFPASDKDWSAIVGDLKSARTQNYRRGLWLVMSAVGLLFAIAIANTAALTLTQVSRRANEFAVLSALGASRRHILTEVLREATIVATISVGLGCALTGVLLRLMQTQLKSLPRPTEITLDWRAFLLAIVAGYLAAVFCGWLSVLRGTRVDISSVMNASGRGMSGERHRWQYMLATSQIALTFGLISSAGLMLQTYRNLTRSDPGFDSSRALTFHLGAAWDEDRERIGRMQTELLEQMASMPGVRSAGFANFLPASGATLRYQFTLEGNAIITAGERSVTRDYFSAVGTQLVAGQSCPELRAMNHDVHKAVVNRRFVDQFSPGMNPIGRSLQLRDNKATFEITGVVADAREDALNTAPVPYVYVCLAPGDWPDPEYVVRTEGDPQALFAAVRKTAHRIDSTRAIFGLATLSDVVNATLDQPRLESRMLTFFAIAGLLLAGVGIYCLATLIVLSGKREIGVRMALGATPQEIARRVLGNVTRLLFVGMLAGLAAALAAAQGLRALLFGVGANDATTLAATAIIIAVVMLAAGWIPARRAAKLDPLQAMRAE